MSATSTLTAGLIASTLGWKPHTAVRTALRRTVAFFRGNCPITSEVNQNPANPFG